ncbi:MAG: transglutaminase family protein, partial [Gammaproteobacteria bacterium]|nr:transglutaminase family protein [Gammaproteobacteria bacterium]
HGQGKWYPGEPLPRWAFSCFWRDDGEAIWREPALIADPARDHGHQLADAQRLVNRIAEALGVGAGLVQPAFEDVYYYLWKEATLPVDVDPLSADLSDPLERRRLVRLLERGLDKVSGYALPLRADPLADPLAPMAQRWVSGRWPFRRERLYLLPGDSPMGFRLPLDSIGGEPPELVEQPDSMSPRGPLPPRMQLEQRSRAAATVTPLKRAEPAEVVRTALCVEPRDGRLHVFLPPLTRMEHFLELVAAVELAARECGTPVLLEGYEPPVDPRVKVLRVTPDPGVIEVNIHPQKSWREIVRSTEDLYEIARNTRLGTEKFMVDGRHTGTGGGNHVTLGGPTPADSPLLRRPDLLRSLLTYWQHHPALSYLFSGAFIGPTSQAPRVDEARHENLYELEIAFQQMASVPRLASGESAAPWAIDRALRHLLTDLTGNTHRAEFCIDKLYSPDGPAGRQGLVEFRAFEMPPHAQMSALQVLLLRALVARFWERPYEHAPRRWGTELHDRFMLPWFVQHDLSHVVDELQRAGADFELDWFDPFLEFRFPRYGSVVVDGVELVISAALEPWHVLGEEMFAGGTARFVDSSVERVQVHARGVLTGRHALLCNGRRVPLHPTGTAGEYVAGVRFKAW